MPYVRCVIPGWVVRRGLIRMFHSSIWLVATFIVANVKSEDCNCQFTVPDTLGLRCNGEETFRMKSSIDHINAELVIAERRQQAMSEDFSREMSKLDNGVENMKNVSTMFRMDLQQLQSTVSNMATVAEEVKGLRDMITNSKESLEPKFAALQEQMMGIVEKFQNESSKVSEYAHALVTSQTTQLAHHAQSIISLKKESDELKVQSAEQKEIIADLSQRLQTAEAALSTDLSQIHSLKSSLNLLQSTFTTAYRRNRDDIQALKKTVSDQGR
ncbi:uncharacterized protein LOC117335172 [Pecten maximus]|uniref:uncharacterized protein LOC117335172 n=1 Tax=Pecten maximus TaxID=6579 RepID=UPI00145836CC|nr:uncharacterized protein LOC117335172 [Pecten maximus]